MQKLSWTCACGKSHPINADFAGNGGQLALTLCIGCGEPHQIRPQGAHRVSWPVVAQLLRFEPDKLRQFAQVRAVLRSAN
jgi:hypothetical protein